MCAPHIFLDGRNFMGAPAPSAPVAPMPLSVITGPLERLISILSCTHMHSNTQAHAHAHIHEHQCYFWP